MTTRRNEKFTRLIQKEMSYIFLNEGKRYFGDAMISVTRVTVSPDFGYVKVYLNFLNIGDHQKMIEIIQSHNRELRMALGQRIRNQVRKVPELTFFYDDTLDYYERMDEVFKNLKKSEGEQ